MEWVAFVTAVAFIGAMAFLAIFMTTERRVFDALANWCFLVQYAGLGALIVALHRDYVDAAPLVWVFTLVGMAGVIVSLVGQLSTMFFGVSFERIAVRQTAAFGGVLVWIAGIGVVVLLEGGLPDGLAWTGLGATVVAILLIGLMSRDPALMRGARKPTATEMAFAMLPILAIPVWLIWLGVEL